jgi:hypothetical protein
MGRRKKGFGRARKAVGENGKVCGCETGPYGLLFFFFSSSLFSAERKLVIFFLERESVCEGNLLSGLMFTWAVTIEGLN